MLLSRSLRTFLLPNPKASSWSSSYLSFTPSSLENTCFAWRPHGHSPLTALYFAGHEPAVSLLVWFRILPTAFKHQRSPRLRSALLFLCSYSLSGSSHPVSCLYVTSMLIIPQFLSPAQSSFLNSRLIYPTAYLMPLPGCLIDIKNLTSPKSNS